MLSEQMDDDFDLWDVLSPLCASESQDESQDARCVFGCDGFCREHDSEEIVKPHLQAEVAVCADRLLEAAELNDQLAMEYEMGTLEMRAVSAVLLKSFDFCMTALAPQAGVMRRRSAGGHHLGG